MRKILYVHANSNIIGGIETFLENSLWNHSKFEPHVIFVNDGVLPQRIREKGFKNIAVFNASRLRYLHQSIPAIVRVVRYIRHKKMDAVVGHGHHAWIYAGLAAKLSGTPGIFYAHGILRGPDAVLTNLIDFIGTRIKPSMIFANSIATKQSIERHYEGMNVELLYPGIDQNQLKANQEVSYIRAALGIPDFSKVVTMIGRIQEWKGQEYFVRAAALVAREIPDVFFLVVGSPTFDQDQLYLDKLNRIADQLKIKQQVIFTGFRKDIADILAASDILVHASTIAEPFGLVIVEGMASGKAVIATDAGGPAEIIKDGWDGILVPPKSDVSLAQAITRLLKNDEFRNVMQQNARKTVEERFSIQWCIQEMERKIEACLGARSRHAQV